MGRDDLELIRRIAAVVGHELRNPLAVINNSAYFLKTKLGSDGRLDPKVEKHLGIVSSEIARLNGMIEDILVYSRPIEVQKKPAALDSLAAAAAAAMAVPDKVKISVKIKKGLEAPIDEKLFTIALRRLLDNAVEALGDGGSIVVSGEKVGAEAVIEVLDSGKGFAEEALARFGQAFSTTRPRGLGLGLAMAQKIVQAHGGSLEGENRKQGGASVRIKLPIA